MHQKYQILILQSNNKYKELNFLATITVLYLITHMYIKNSNKTANVLTLYFDTVAIAIDFSSSICLSLSWRYLQKHDNFEYKNLATHTCKCIIFNLSNSFSYLFSMMRASRSTTLRSSPFSM